MAVDIGPKIGIDGEREFRQELNQINTMKHRPRHSNGSKSSIEPRRH